MDRAWDTAIGVSPQGQTSQPPEDVQLELAHSTPRPEGAGVVRSAELRFKVLQESKGWFLEDRLWRLGTKVPGDEWMG